MRAVLWQIPGRGSRAPEFSPCLSRIFTNGWAKSVTRTRREKGNEPGGASVHAEEAAAGTMRVAIAGRLDAVTTGGIWRKTMDTLNRSSPKHVVVDASKVHYCDISGAGLFVGIAQRQRREEGTFEVLDLRKDFRQLIDLFDPEKLQVIGPVLEKSKVKKAGEAAYAIWLDTREMIVFLGRLCVALAGAIRRPYTVRWGDMWLTAERAGVNALPIIALVSFLVGLIMAFQSSIPMRQFGAQIYVANLVSLSMLRELGPLMMALVLAGRTGSAFAAELGTMKVSEEIDALVTMGLEPVEFLVVTRVIAAVVMAPLLTVFADLLGVLGGGVVLLSLGFSMETYYYQVLSAATYGDLLGGIVKSVAFGLIVAGVGCARGLQTRVGAAAVGESATRSVVTGIILIIVADGTFAVIYYILGV